MDREYTYYDVLVAKTAEEVNEASLGRAFQHFQRRGDKSFAIITAWRQGLTSRENQSNMKKLEQDIRSLGLGFFKMRGVGQEKDDDGNVVEASEPSLWVNGLNLKQAIRLARKYDQDFFIFAGPESDGQVVGYDNQGRKVDTIAPMGKFSPAKVSQFFSRIKGHPFVFEALPNSWAEGYVRNRTRPNLSAEILSML